MSLYWRLNLDPTLTFPENLLTPVCVCVCVCVCVFTSIEDFDGET